MLDHFDEFSTVFGRDGAMLSVLLVVSLALTAFHVYQEWKGGAVPLWRVFGAIVGVRLPDRLGFLLFTVVLTLVLWALSVQGMTGWPLASKWSSFALGALIGARISDSIVSHWILYAMGYRPNPGLTSTPLYIAEAALLAYVFWEGLSLHPLGAWGGVAAGAIFFVLVLPSFWFLGALFGDWRRPRWARGTTIPDWTASSRR